MKDQEIKQVVRERYGKVAKSSSCGCSPGCCGTSSRTAEISQCMGYSEQELSSVPQGANLGLGCGNPVALASLKEGETVLDLGSGAGFDCFLAADKVGKSGRVIGVDMTPEMVRKAKGNARKGGYKNVEFRLGEIENLPVEDSTIDAIISNCVINLSPAKGKVFREAYRVLKPGGRLMVSDIVLIEELPEELRSSIEAYVGCLAGAVKEERYLEEIESAGFKEAKVMDETSFPIEYMVNDPLAKTLMEGLNISREKFESLAKGVLSVKVFARKGIPHRRALTLRAAKGLRPFGNPE